MFDGRPYLIRPLNARQLFWRCLLRFADALRRAGGVLEPKNPNGRIS